jgi:Tfp pilus assembly protein PilX
MKLNRRRRCDGGRDGAVLGLVLIVLVVLSVLGTSMMGLTTADSVEAAKAVSAAQAFWNAEAGLEHAKSLAYHNREPFDVMGVYGQSALNGTTSEGSYSVSITDDPNWVNTGNTIKRYILRSTGTSLGGVARVVQERAEIQTFANYMHASHHERTAGGSRIYFGPSDVIDGQIYCNDQINIYGSARILDLARSAASSVYYRGGGDSSTFEGGLTLNAPMLDFQGIYSEDHVHHIRDIAQTGGLVLGGDHDIRFRGTGIMRYRPTGGEWTDVPLSSLNGAVYVNGNVRTWGVVKGNVTVASEGEIGIDNNGVIYKRANGGTGKPTPFDPAFNADNVPDSLGLVARNSVTVIPDHEMNIHAAILVTDDGAGFGAVERYSNIGNPPINLYGSVSQFRRGVVGRVGGDGFRKNYKYDTRLLQMAPPHYPYSAYAFSQWDLVP